MFASASIRNLVNSSFFKAFSTSAIIVNALLTGIQLSNDTFTLEVFHQIILAIFVIEIVLRFIGRVSTKEYFNDGWNFFDIIVVGLSIALEDILGSVSTTVIRTVRILRVFRILHTIDELRLITVVLLNSLRSLGYSAVLFFISNAF